MPGAVTGHIDTTVALPVVYPDPATRQYVGCDIYWNLARRACKRRKREHASVASSTSTPSAQDQHPMVRVEGLKKVFFHGGSARLVAARQRCCASSTGSTI